MSDASEPADAVPSRLSRRLGLRDAVMIGLGSMIGAGVFAAIGPAAAAAGGGLLIGLAIAAIVAFCNAMASAQLAALYPSSGGTYVYGRERLGHLWGFLAGWAFVVGKTASCAAMALTFGSYVAPTFARPLGVGAVIALSAINLRGVQKTALATRAIVAITVGALTVVVTAAVAPSTPDVGIGSLTDAGARGVLEAAGFLFFAFAGYARIATLGEEVRDPARTIPRAIPIALGVTVVVYAVVAYVSLEAVGPTVLANSAAPLTEVTTAAGWAWATPIVMGGAAVASLGVLMSMLVGVSRTTFAMAGEGDLPRWLDSVHPERRVPDRAELAVATVVIAVVLIADVRGAIGFSSFAVLFYYGVANASAFTLSSSERRWPRGLSVVGLTGCAAVAASLPPSSTIGGCALIAIGAATWAFRRRA